MSAPFFNIIFNSTFITIPLLREKRALIRGTPLFEIGALSSKYGRLFNKVFFDVQKDKRRVIKYYPAKCYLLR